MFHVSNKCKLRRYCEIAAILTQLSTPKPTSNAANFNHLLQHLQNVEDLKKKTTEDVASSSKRRKNTYSLEDEIRDTLAKVEGVPGPSQTTKRKKTRRGSEVESDWEEVRGKLAYEHIVYHSVEKLIQK